MAKKQTKEKNPPALALKEILGAIDLKASEVWDQLNDQEKDCVNFFTLNRYISSAGAFSKREIQEHYVLAVNEYYNKHFFAISKHPKLLWLLLCQCSHEDREVIFNEYIKLQKSDNKRINFLKMLFPNRKLVDLEVLAEINTDKELKDIGRSYGMTEKEIAQYI